MADALSAAKGALHSANEYTKSVEGTSPSRFASKHDYSNVPYSVAHAAKATGLGSELKAKAENVKQYEDATK